MNLMDQIKDGILAVWLPRALRTMSKQDMLKLIDLICRLNPGWKENVAFAAELIERDHPFFQWVQ